MRSSRKRTRESRNAPRDRAAPKRPAAALRCNARGTRTALMQSRLTHLTVSTQPFEVPMNISVVRLLGIATVIVTSACAAQTEPASEAPDLEVTRAALAKCPSKIPPELAIPEGNKLAFSFGASGVQRYVCADDGSKWTFIEPVAELYDKHGRVAGHHYKGPTWEAVDGSTVAAASIAAVVVDANSIPWLKLEAKSHSGAGHMSEVTFIQRLNTQGGLAPAAPCTPAATVDVDYTATYAFYEAKPAKKH
jgi:hypothetical protein